MEKIAVLYFGSRGAGINFFNFTIEALGSKKIECIPISKLQANIKHNLQLVVKIPKNKVLLYFGYTRRKTLDKVLEFLQENKVGTVIIPMAHPWDLKLQKALELKLIKIVRIVHDGETHLGEYFPSTRDIEIMQSATQVIALSEYVAQQLRKTQKPVIVTTHPIFEKKIETEIPRINGLKFPYDLIIGRHKRYQRTGRAINWWCGLTRESRGDSYLVIAGNINFLSLVRYRYSRRVIFIRKWLTEHEYNSLIQSANQILCLYQEASQSGVIASSRAFDRPVLCTDVGGLPEQIYKYQNGVCVPNNKMLSWELGYNSLKNLRIPSLHSIVDFSLANALVACCKL